MRIAVLIISLCLVMVVGLQSCVANFGGAISNDDNLSGAAGAGILLALIFMIGGALVMQHPKASMILYIIGATIAWSGATQSEFKDLYFWACISSVLAFMSYIGMRQMSPKSTVDKKDEANVASADKRTIQYSSGNTLNPFLKTLAENKKNIALVIVAVVFIAIVMPSDKQRKQEQNASQQLAEVQPEKMLPTGKLADIFDVMSDYTDLQREQELQNIKGKVVQWILPVYEVSKRGDEYIIQTSGSKSCTYCSENVGTFVTIVPRTQEEVDFLHTIKTNSMIKFKGVISGSTMRNLDIEPAILILHDEVVHTTPESTNAENNAHNQQQKAAEEVQLEKEDKQPSQNIETESTVNKLNSCYTSHENISILQIASCQGSYTTSDIDEAKDVCIQQLKKSSFTADAKTAKAGTLMCLGRTADAAVALNQQSGSNAQSVETTEIKQNTPVATQLEETVKTDNCREYTTKVMIDGKIETGHGLTCLNANGDWVAQSKQTIEKTPTKAQNNFQNNVGSVLFGSSDISSMFPAPAQNTTKCKKRKNSSGKLVTMCPDGNGGFYQLEAQMNQ